MRLFEKTIVSLLAAVVALATPTLGGAYLYWRPSLPETSGHLAAPGLKGPVEVIRDRWGIPHIYAQDEDDLFFAQGYVQAQDRLWQLELCRRAARGTMAEVLGEEALASDRLARTLGLAQEAEADWPMLEPEIKQALEAYARGINAYLSAPGRRLPVEFAVLGYTPAPWGPVDSLAWAKLMAWSQSSDWQRELLRARLVRAAGPEKAAELEMDGAQPVSIPGELADLAVVAQTTLPEKVGHEWPWVSPAGSGTSCWVVDGSKTAGGRPLLANDLQSSAEMPSTWYEMHLVGGRYDVEGATTPGIPGVVVGRNRAIAWGLAGEAADVQDLYVEHVRSSPELQVEYQGQWEEAGFREEQVKVRGRAEPVLVPVYTTRHGPLITLPSSDGREALALQWAGAGQPSALVRCLLPVNRATNWEQFQSALRGWTVPPQTLMYADARGNIGYSVAGGAPLRAHGDGRFPAPGWTGGYEWTGIAQASALPSALNPGPAIVAADGAAALAGYPGMGPAPADVWRTERVEELISARPKLTADDMAAIQNDLRGPEQPLRSLLLALPPEGWVQERTTPYLRDWDLQYGAESVGAGVYEVFCWRLAHNILDDELGPELVDSYLNLQPNWRAFIETVTALPDSPWLGHTGAGQYPGRDDLLRRSYAEALDWLGTRLGDLPYEWNWGRVHSVLFTHALGKSWPLTFLLNRGAMRAGGGAVSVDAASPDYESRLAARTISGFRLIADLGDSSGSLAMIPTGQSGNPLSRHFADMIQPWREGRYHRLLYRREVIVQAKEAAIVLEPVAQSEGS